MPEKHDANEELAEQMHPVPWGRFEKWMASAILLLVVLNLIVGILALGPDIWGSY